MSEFARPRRASFIGAMWMHLGEHIHRVLHAHICKSTHILLTWTSTRCPHAPFRPRTGVAACAGGRGFASLGGVSHHAAALRELVALPLRAGALFAAARLRPPRGVLLHGPPGSGKTVLAVAAAQDAGATLFTLNGPDVISEFYGGADM